MKNVISNSGQTRLKGISFETEHTRPYRWRDRVHQSSSALVVNDIIGFRSRLQLLGIGVDLSLPINCQRYGFFQRRKLEPLVRLDCSGPNYRRRNTRHSGQSDHQRKNCDSRRRIACAVVNSYIRSWTAKRSLTAISNWFSADGSFLKRLVRIRAWISELHDLLILWLLDCTCLDNSNVCRLNQKNCTSAPNHANADFPTASTTILIHARLKA
jgi:hypothetical protein